MGAAEEVGVGGVVEEEGRERLQVDLIPRPEQVQADPLGHLDRPVQRELAVQGADGSGDPRDPEVRGQGVEGGDGEFGSGEEGGVEVRLDVLGAVVEGVVAVVMVETGEGREGWGRGEEFGAFGEGRCVLWLWGGGC